MNISNVWMYPTMLLDHGSMIYTHCLSQLYAKNVIGYINNNQQERDNLINTIYIAHRQIYAVDKDNISS